MTTAPPTQSTAPRRPRRRLWAIGMLALSAVVVAAVLEPIWARPLIRHYVFERSGRRIDFDALHVRFDRRLRPVVSLRNLEVENAPWAAARPLVRAARFEFTLAWESLGGERVVITRLVLADAELDLERQADGRRNWRVTHPDDRGPGKVWVQSIDASDVKARLVQRGFASGPGPGSASGSGAASGSGLELELQARPLPAATTLPGHADLPLVKTVDATGSRDGHPFEFHAEVSRVLNFSDTGEPFAVRGRLRAGAASASAEGVVADLIKPTGLDLALRVDRVPLDRLGAAFGITARLPPVPSEASAQVQKRGDTWHVTQLKASLGASDLAGEAQLVRRPASDGPSTLTATLTSTHLDLRDLRPPRAMAREASRPQASTTTRQTTQPTIPTTMQSTSHTPTPAATRTATRTATQTANPSTATPPDRGGLDADIDWKAATVEGVPLGPAVGLSAHAALRSGRLVLEPLAFSVGGGQVSGTAMFDSARAPAEAGVDLRLRGFQIERLARHARGLEPIAGALDMKVALRARGDSLASLAAAVSGSVKAELVQASIPEALDAKLGLDGGHWLRTVVGTEQRTPITCSAIEFHFDQGRGAARRLALETDHVRLAGTGWIDLGRGSFELLLTPHRKQTAVFAIDRSMRVGGPFSAPTLALVEPVAGEVAACAPGTAR